MTGIRAELILDSLRCDRTTEAKADEVFIAVGGRRTDGVRFEARLPEAQDSEDQHWDMNDGDHPSDNPDGDSRIITGHRLCTLDIPAGQEWVIIVAVMEEDGGNTRGIQRVIAEELVKSGNPIAAAAGIVLGAFTLLGGGIDDSDDYLGSFLVRLVNNGGTLGAEWRALERIDMADQQIVAYGAWHFRLIGDGGDYLGNFRVQQV